MADFVDVKEVYEVEGYVRSMVSRVESLETTVVDLELRHEDFGRNLSKFKKGTLLELADMKGDVLFLKESVKEIQKMITLMIGQMKSTLKQDDFQRFERRLDSWGPETLVSRSEAMRVVRRIKN